jgi:hypothetical protein
MKSTKGENMGSWYMFEQKAFYEHAEYFLKTLSGKVHGPCVPKIGGFETVIGKNFIPANIIVSIRTAKNEEKYL